jgi:tetratricopeptide (TPR) repeat protein
MGLLPTTGDMTLATGSMREPWSPDIISRAIESGDPGLAQEALREIDARLRETRTPAERANLILARADLYRQSKRFADARNEMDLALQEAPDDWSTQMQAAFLAGDLSDDEGNPEQACEQLTEALAKYADVIRATDHLRPIYEAAQLRRGLALHRIRCHEDAIPILKETLAFELNGHNRSIVLFKLGVSCSELKMWPEAESYLEQALTPELPNDLVWQAHYGLGMVYAYERLLEEAKREFQICEQHAPELAAGGLSLITIYDWLSRISKALGQRADAERYARLAQPS